MSSLCTAANTTASAWEDWVHAEFEGAGLGDARLDRRLLQIVAAFMASPMSSIPQACGGWAGAKAAYRFLDNDKVDPQIIYERHRKSALERAKGKPVVLAIADTTMLDYTSHTETEGLGPLGSLVHHGMLLHPTLLVTPTREPLGVVDVQTWVRDIDEFGKSSARRSRDVSEKETQKWLASMEAAERLQQDVGPDTQVVSVFDREGDVYDILATARLPDRSSTLLVRAKADRRLKHPQQKIWEHLADQPIASTVAVEVPRKTRQQSRVAELSVRFARITVLPPGNCPASEGYLPIDVYAVYAHEDHPPGGTDPVSWMLVTTVPVESADDAWDVVQWYCCRWQIEILFKVLKSGCAAEERQLETAERLKRCLAIDLVVAFRILQLTMLGRETPDLPCTVVFEDYEWKALYVFIARSRKAVPTTTPTLREVTRMVGRLGGHLGRRQDGEPGVLTMWRGLQRLPDIAEMWQVFEADG